MVSSRNHFFVIFGIESSSRKKELQGLERSSYT
jgi:hypothetical protein